MPMYLSQDMYNYIVLSDPWGNCLMKQQAMKLEEWNKHFGTAEQCLEEVARHRWKDGFRCPTCGHDQAWVLKRHCIRECRACRWQASPTAGTLFEHTRLPLNQWFLAIYLMTVDKGGISAVRLAQVLGVQWRTAQLMLNKLRRAMADRDLDYVVQGIVEVDDGWFGGTRPGKRGRGAEGRRPVLVAVERRADGCAGFAAMQTVDRVNGAAAQQFVAKYLGPEAEVRSDALRALGAIGASHRLDQRITTPEQVADWLPKVHRIIANAKRFLLGTFHGVSHRYRQLYLDEFIFRFNRRQWLDQLPQRLVYAATIHVPAPARML